MANVKAISIGLITTIIVVVVIFQLIGNTSTSLTDAGNNIILNCEGNVGVNSEELTDNYTSMSCDNSTTKGVATYNSQLPLTSLFGGSGVILLIFMAGLLIFVVTLVLKKWKQ